jgi:hypothetical protein
VPDFTHYHLVRFQARTEHVSAHAAPPLYSAPACARRASTASRAGCEWPTRGRARPSCCARATS